MYERIVAFFLSGPRRGEYLMLPKRFSEYEEPLPQVNEVTMTDPHAPMATVRAVYRPKGPRRPRPGGWEQDYEFVGVRL